MKLKVLIVDDSALVRSVLKEIVNSQPDMEVVGAAPDPLVARAMIKSLNPDVLTLDVEMPQMDGLEFLEKLMRLRPMPVVMVSSLTESGSDITFRALELGAVDFVTKPKAGSGVSIYQYADDIADKIRAAAAARLRSPGQQPPSRRSKPLVALRNGMDGARQLILIGASTGGTEAIREVLTRMPSDSPGILIVQHMPAGFTQSFADRLDGLCRIHVRHAADRELILPGHAYIAPGNAHLQVHRIGSQFLVHLDDGPPVNRHRPSVEVLFRSAAELGGGNMAALMLTGMGRDGAEAMLALKQAGARTFAQDESSCVVFGMPKAAIELGAVDEVGPLDLLAKQALAWLRKGGSESAGTVSPLA